MVSISKLFVLAGFLVVAPLTCGAENKTLWCASFVQADNEACSDESWTGVLKDMFSPDDTCPNSTRYIDAVLGEKGSFVSLEISASGTDAFCNSTWGRRFNSSTSVNPTISRVPGAGPCVRATSFVSKVPEGDPLYDDAQAGALNFTLKLGTVMNSSSGSTLRVNMWNGPYNGAGGDMAGTTAPPSECDNFWLYSEQEAPRNQNKNL